MARSIKYPVDKLHGRIWVFFESWIQGPFGVLWLRGRAGDSFYGPPQLLLKNIDAGNLAKKATVSEARK